MDSRNKIQKVQGQHATYVGYSVPIKRLLAETKTKEARMIFVNQARYE
jgi:hypothetical protein